MITRTLGALGPHVSALGLGCMGMSDLYGTADRNESLLTLQAAVEDGITLLDTGDYYGMGHNELLIRDALRDIPRDRVILSVKFGALRDAKGAWTGVDARPAAVKNFLAYSLRRLGTEYIDIYRPGRIDPQVPIEDTVGAIAEAIQAGWVRYVGLSEVGADTLRRAHVVHPVADLQIEYSLFSRGIETAVLPAARELGIGLTAYGVLSRGLLSGHWSKERRVDPGDIRNYLPRFNPENLGRNLDLVEVLRTVAAAREATVAQVAIAWVLAQGEDIVPLVGARTRMRLRESLGALDVVLKPEEMARIERALPSESVAGTRYDSHQMGILDSERTVRQP